MSLQVFVDYQKKKEPNRFQTYKGRDAVNTKPLRDKANRTREIMKSPQIISSPITPSHKPTQIQVEFKGIKLFRSDKKKL